MEYLPFTFDAASEKPLYQQLYAYLAAQIAAGRLPAGEKLPPKRSLAANLGTSLNTVETALGMLAAEGYVQPRARSGVYVADIAPLVPAARPLPQKPEPPVQSGAQYNFLTSGVDTALFPFKTWGRITREVLADAPALLNHGSAEGDDALREAIAVYLHDFRAVNCAPHQIIVGAGMEYLLSLLAGLLPHTIALEDPGYPKARQIFENAGLAVRPVAVDEEGLSVAQLAKSGAEAVYVTPSHQFPTGVMMPFGRRSALLQWAAQSESRMIVEDDYDSEFRFDGRPIPSLQGLDSRGQVVYVGTFSRSIAPGIRIGYLVLPPRLLKAYHTRFAAYSCTVSRIEQQTLARFLTDGHFTRCVNRARGHYRARRDTLLAALRQELGQVQVHGAHTGLHLVATPPLKLPEEMLTARAQAAGVALRGISHYGTVPRWLPGPSVVLGYGTLDEAGILAGLQRLAAAWRQGE